MDAMLECVKMSHSNSWSAEPMMQLKITALISADLCVRHTPTDIRANSNLLVGSNVYCKTSVPKPALMFLYLWFLR